MPMNIRVSLKGKIIDCIQDKRETPLCTFKPISTLAPSDGRYSCYEATSMARSHALHESGHRRGELWATNVHNYIYIEDGDVRTYIYIYIRPCGMNITIGVSVRLRAAM
jgi:hypothetical protein